MGVAPPGPPPAWSGRHIVDLVGSDATAPTVAGLAGGGAALAANACGSFAWRGRFGTGTDCPARVPLVATVDADGRPLGVGADDTGRVTVGGLTDALTQEFRRFAPDGTLLAAWPDPAGIQFVPSATVLRDGTLVWGDGPLYRLAPDLAPLPALAYPDLPPLAFARDGGVYTIDTEPTGVVHAIAPGGTRAGSAGCRGSRAPGSTAGPRDRSSLER